MTELERIIKNAYNEVLARRVSLMGRQVRIGAVVQTIKENYPEIFSKDQINGELLRLFYIKNIIDLSPGNTFYYIDDKNGNTFGYMLWRNEEHLEEIEESHKNNEETKWFRCTNCWGEYRLDDLGLFITSEDNKLAYFCPVCGFWELCTSEEAPHDEKIQDILEDGPDQVYEYPGKIIKPVNDKIYLENHEEMLNEYKARRRKELNKKTMDFKHLFNNS